MSQAAIVLAAGLGKRMKSAHPKVLTPLLSKPLIGYVVGSLRAAGIAKIIVVIGHKGEEVQAHLGDGVEYAWQDPPQGTGHAVQVAMPLLDGFEGDVIIACGDAPLVSHDTFRRLLKERGATSSSAIVVTTTLPHPGSYGRVKRAVDGSVSSIVEFRDATQEERKINEINTGLYCFGAAKLRESVAKLDNRNAQKEYYLTDTLEILLAAGSRVGALLEPNASEFLGVNDPADLAEIEEVLLTMIRRRHLSAGIVMESPATIRIDSDVEIGARTRLRPGVILEGSTSVGEDCVIGPNVILTDAVIPNGTTVAPGLIRGPAPGQE